MCKNRSYTIITLIYCSIVLYIFTQLHLYSLFKENKKKRQKLIDRIPHFCVVFFFVSSFVNTFWNARANSYTTSANPFQLRPAYLIRGLLERECCIKDLQGAIERIMEIVCLSTPSTVKPPKWNDMENTAAPDGSKRKKSRRKKHTRELLGEVCEHRKVLCCTCARSS